MLVFRQCALVLALLSLPYTLKAQRYRFSFDGGMGYKFGSMPDSVNLGSGYKNYQKNLKFGTTFNFDLQYFQGYKGFGFKYLQFVSSSRSDTLGFGRGKGVYWDKIKVEYLGLQLLHRKALGNSGFTLYTSMGIGRIFYSRFGGQPTSDSTEMPISRFASPWGVDWSLSLDYKINENVAIGFSINNLIGVLTQATDGDGLIYNYRESLTRMDGYVGLKIYL